MRVEPEKLNCQPTKITLHSVSRILEISFNDGQTFRLPFEYLRVFTPSAEAVGHGPGQEVLQLDKHDVTINSVKAIGNYAIAPQFSDGHNSGLYTWALLYKLGKDHQLLWARYLEKLKLAGHPYPHRHNHDS